jgi:hypothetical protein
MADSTIRFSLFLVPFRSPAPMPSCAAIGSNHVRITMGDSTDDFYLSPAGSGDTRVTTDAECLWLHSVGGNVRTIAVVGGTFARLDGVEILRLRARGSGEVAVR